MTQTTNAPRTVIPRIANLVPGDHVTLRFNGSRSLGNEPREDVAVFIGITGTDDDRHAEFISTDGGRFPGDRTYRWEAYRFEGRWVYGTSAERLTLVRIDTLSPLR